MIIDMHTHTFPDNIAKAAMAGMVHEVARKTGYVINNKTEGTLEALSETTKRSGIDLSIVIPVATKPEQSASINRFAMMTNEKTDETSVFSFGAIHPDNVDYKDILRDVYSRGLKGIKIHPDYQGVDFDDERYIRIMDYAAEMGLIIVTHAGEDVGFPEKIRCTPDKVLNVLRYIQPEKLVLAHMGGWNMWNEVEEKLVGKNVYFDTAFSTEEYPCGINEEQFVRMVKNHGADKILFGTDSPWTDQTNALNTIKRIGFHKETEAMILGGNAQKLLGI